MEYLIKDYVSRLPGKGSKINKAYAVTIIRYAADFVIPHEDLNVIQNCQKILTEWLKDMGLELKPSKTRLTHTLLKYSTWGESLTYGFEDESVGGLIGLV